ncbi:MAG: alpha/beta fold hydrolase [Acidimicrobiales bacterium]
MLRSFADGKLMGDTFGSRAPTVLALHGWARSRRDFSAVMAPAGSDPIDAIALDLPGFGASPPPPAPWGSTEYAELVAEVFVEMDPPVILLGHSLGGRVAVALAAANPEAVAGVVLTGVPLRRPTLRRPGTPLAFRMGRVLNRHGLVSDAAMESLRNRYGSTDYKAAQGVMRQVLVRLVNEQYEEMIAAIRCPAALIWGSDDVVAPPTVAQDVLGEFTDAHLTLLPGVGHLTPSVAPAALHDAVIDMLRARHTR